MKILTTDLRGISREPTLRCDYDYHEYKREIAGACYMFADLFKLNDSSAVDADDLYVDFRYCEIGNADKAGDVEPELLNFDNRDLLTENYYKKIEGGDIIPVTAGDILISKVRPNLKKYVRITPDLADCYFTSAFISLCPKRLTVILYYALRTLFYQNLVAISRQGKGYPTLNVNDLRLMQFDKAVIDTLAANEERLTREIIEIEEQIRTRKATIRPAADIINEVFGREFGFDYAEFKRLKAIKVYPSETASFSNNVDLRFSAKFHRGAGAFVLAQLAAITEKKVKHYLAEPIVLGTSVSPVDYSDDGEFYYISMATIKRCVFDREAAQTVTEEFSDAKQAKTIRKDDIILARSGEGTIGKVALIDDEELQGVFADFTMRIRLTGYNQRFAYYYFRTAYFQYLIEVHKKGLGNNTNIFPSMIQEFPLIDIPSTEQQRIVNEIQTELDRHEATRRDIATLREQIEAKIVQAVATA